MSHSSAMTCAPGSDGGCAEFVGTPSELSYFEQRKNAEWYLETVLGRCLTFPRQTDTSAMLAVLSSGEP